MALSEVINRGRVGTVGDVDSRASALRESPQELTLEEIISCPLTAWQLTRIAAATGRAEDINRAKALARTEGRLSNLITTIVLFNSEK
jgi:hypothetical protein